MGSTKITYALLLALSMSVAPLDTASAQPCPGTMAGAVTTHAYVSNTMSSTAMTFIGPGCTVMGVGPVYPSACRAFGGGTYHVFSAMWSSTAGRLAAGSTGGCSIMCQGTGTMGTTSPSCFVRASDGLPVELMEFNVESE